MDAIHELAKQYGFSIIEDASHAIGSTYLDEPVGNGRYSDITIFSFHPVKIITTGEGGMALTNKIDLAERMMLFRNHGITREPDQMSRPPDGPWYYEQIALGFNYRMTDIQAALGISQAKRLDKYIMRRRYLANRYDKLLAELPVTLTEQYNNAQSAWHLYVVRLQLEKLTKTHIQVFEELRDAGIGVNLHYIPIYAQPDFQRFEYNYNDFPEAEAYYRTAISLPLYPNLTEEQQDQVVLALVKALI
jgi:dTDP-4-amino-4,6-dideoxygalactose transaminase